MKQKAINVAKAFATGFAVVAVSLWLMQIFAPILGFEYAIGWHMTFDIGKGAANTVRLSWFAPIVVGLIFAAIQLLDDFESSLSKAYRRAVKRDEMRETITVLWSGVEGLALGFVLLMFLLSIIAGTNRTYIIPFLLEASADGSSVQASTTILTIFAALGLIWGIWKANHLPKHRELAKSRKKKRK